MDDNCHRLSPIAYRLWSGLKTTRSEKMLTGSKKNRSAIRVLLLLALMLASMGWPFVGAGANSALASKLTAGSTGSSAKPAQSGTAERVSSPRYPLSTRGLQSVEAGGAGAGSTSPGSSGG